jgi:hypothetical protein
LRVRHEDANGELFGDVLALGEKAGLVRAILLEAADADAPNASGW